MERAIIRFGLDSDFAGIGEVDGVADKVDQNLRQTPPVAVTRRQFGSKLELERELFVGCKRLKRAAHGLRNILNGIIGKFEHELTSLDLGEVQHVIDESKQMLAVGLKSLEYAKHLFR